MRTAHAEWVSAASTAGTKNWRTRSQRLVTRTVALHREVVALLGDVTDLPTVDASRPWWIPQVVDGLVRTCIDALRSEAIGADVHHGDLARVLIGLRVLRAELDAFDLYTRTWRLERCEGVLLTMRASPSPAGTLEQACRALVRSCGFERAMLSRLEEGCWIPYGGYVSGDESLSPWTDSWVGREIPMKTGSVEEEAFRTGRATIGHVSGPRLTRSPAAVEVRTSATYVVAPIVNREDRVVGMLHADHLPTDRDVRSVDRDVLQCFAEGFSQIYVRTVLAETLRQQGARVREAFAATKRMMSDLSDSPIRLGGDLASPSSPSGPRRPTPDPGIVAVLTDRERDVLDLMLVGARNPAIADQLVITPGTVKFHVRNILRKLGVSNRTQAIAACLGTRNVEVDVPG